MNIFKALEFFCLFSGLDKSDAIAYIPLISSSGAAIERKLKDESLAESDEVAEIAAALCFYRYCLAEEAATSGSFTAGTVKIEAPNRSALAKANLETITKMYSDIFVSDDLIFFEVS